MSVFRPERRPSQKESLPSFKKALFLAIGIALLILAGLIAVHYVTNMSGMLKKHEQLNIQQQGDVVNGVLQASIENVQSVARDWSSWDETYYFALGENDDFIESTYNTDYLLLLHSFSFMVIKDLSGSDLYVKFLDLTSEDPLPAPEGFTNLLTRLGGDVAESHNLNQEYSFKDKLGKDGFIFYNDVCYYICALPILTSEETDGPAGSFFFGRVFDETEIRRITNSENLNFKILDLYSPEVQALQLNFSAEGEAYCYQKDSYTYYKLMSDFNGLENLVLTIEAPRDLYKDGMQVIVLAVLVVVLLLLLFAGLLVFFVNRYLLRPLNTFVSDVQSVTAETVSLDTERYLKSREFQILSTAMNAMLGRLKQSRINLEQSTLSLNVLKNILNGMDALVYVSDPQTDEILFINDKMKEQFGLGEEAVGSICWQVLQAGFTKRCDFCPNNELMTNPDTHIIWEELNTANKRHYRNVDGIIDWIGGQKVHMQHSTDITEIKLADASLKKRFEQQQLMAAISQSFIADDVTDTLISNALKTVGEFMQISGIQLARYDQKEGLLIYEYGWDEQGEEDQKLSQVKIPFHRGTPIFDALRDVNFAPLTVENTSEQDIFQNARDRGIKAFIFVPVFSGGELWGGLEFDNTKHVYAWSKSDVHLGNLFASLLSGVVGRQAMEERLLRMSSIINSSPQYIAYLEKNGQFDFFNPAVLSITGYSAEDLMSGGRKILYDEQTIQYIQTEIIPLIFSQGRHDYEVPITRKDGGVRTMSFSAFTIESDKNGYGVIASDITEKKQLEEELILAKEMAEQSNKAKSEFLSRMSHEMRTPMNAIIGMTHIAIGTKDPEKKEYCLEKIDSTSKHLLEVINDILDMSKIEANKLELSNSEFDFEKMFINITNVVGLLADKKAQNLIVGIDGDVPPLMIGDEMRLSQVITNLLTNAIKFTAQGGMIRLNVHKIHEEGKIITLRIEVADNGIGIAQEQQTRLFSSFEQADGGIARKYGGTGLGLAISKRIVEMMDGQIWIESELGKGATFIFTVKIEKGRSERKSKLHEALDKSELRILAVDDSPEILDYFSAVMDSLNLPCDVAAGGFEALEMIKSCPEKPYNIIFVDWLMPEIDGIELTKKIKEITQENAVVIMISAADWGNIEGEALAAGVSYFISKPLFPSILMNVINEVMGVSPKRKTMTPQTIKYDFSNHTLLLVEDVEVNREIIYELLKDTGVKIDYAQNGLEAVTMFAEHSDRYNLILMDIQMPEMGGHEAAQEIRSLPAASAKNIPIIAMTANVFQEDIEMCFKSGMNDHIGKPIDPNELRGKLNEHLSSKTVPEKEGDGTYKPIQYDDKQEAKSPLNYTDLLPALDVEDGLKRLRNNKKLYFTLLKNFAGRKMADEIIESMENKDYVKTAQAAHALKGVSANLGLTDLFNTAANIEAQAKSERAGHDLISVLNEAVQGAEQAIDTLLEGEGVK